MTPEQLLAQVEFYGSARASGAVAWAASDPAAASNFDTEASAALHKITAAIEHIATTCPEDECPRMPR